MARNHNERPILLSLLDRLLDDDPRVRQEKSPNRHQRLRELKQAVRRDLENLLNTRLRNVTWAAHLAELDRSLLNYGLPDFSDVPLRSSADRDRFCRTLEKVIRQHEPRLLEVRVHSTTDSEPVDRIFRFRIDALLRIEPAPEPVAFD
jgi:type VI secretion system protein ImpF